MRNEKRLGDVVENITVGYVGSMSQEYVDDGIPFLRSLNVQPYRISTNDLKFISREFHQKLRKSTLSPGDVVVVRTGNTGTAAVVPEWLPEANCSDLVIIRPGEKVDAKFLTYYLNSRSGQHSIQSRNVGSVQSHFNIHAALDLPVLLPPLDEQRAIAHILGSLDDKIELNRRMNATLEATARAIFKSWFVDFDPVHAKARGEQPAGMDAETAALLPDAFEDSELGPIPAGWQIKPLDQAIEIISGGTPKTSEPEFWNGNIPWFSVKDVPNEGDVFVIETEKAITQAGIDNSSAKLLPVGTTIISARGTVGKLALVGVPMAMNQSCYGIRSQADSDYYLYFLLHSVIAELQKNTHGTVFDTITRKTFSDIRVIIPSNELMYAFDLSTLPILERIRQSLFETRTLVELRDALLPKLISGEVQISEFGLEKA